MRRWLTVFVLLMGAVPSSAQRLEEGVSPLIQTLQEASLVGLSRVQLRTLAWTYQVRPETLHGILADRLAAGKVWVMSRSEGVVADPPFLRLSYDVKTRTVDGRPVSMYWVSLELVQSVSWNWVVEDEWGGKNEEGLAVTWSALRTDIVPDPELVAFEIERQVASLGDQLAAEIARVNPAWSVDAMSMDPDGSFRCRSGIVKPTRSPKTKADP